MRLYGTIASERASKGQGGENLYINLKDDRGVTFAEIAVFKEEKMFMPSIAIVSLGRVFEDRISLDIDRVKGLTTEKGEKQKGDRTPENIARWLKNGEHDKLQEQDYIKG